MPTKDVDITEIGTVKLTKKRGNRNIRLSITRTGEIRVSMPMWVPYQAGVDFAFKRKGWILKHRPAETKPLTNNMKIGKAHRLLFVPTQTSQTSVRTKAGKIKVTHPGELEITDKNVQTAANRGAIKALKQEADKLLPQRLAQLARDHDYTYKSVSTKRLVSRWGSCSSAKDITLNIYLMQLPWDLIDYVIIHELVHTRHLNHSPEFWTEFESIRPNAKELRKKLKEFNTIISPVAVD